MHGFHLE